MRRIWTCARLSAVGGAAAGRAVAAERPRRGEKFRGLRGLLPGVGRAASMCLVAAARNSPNVRELGAAGRARERRMVIGGDAKRSAAGRFVPSWALAGVRASKLSPVAVIGLCGLCRIVTWGESPVSSMGWAWGGRETLAWGDEVGRSSPPPTTRAWGPEDRSAGTRPSSGGRAGETPLCPDKPAGTGCEAGPTRISGSSRQFLGSEATDTGPTLSASGASDGARFKSRDPSGVFNTNGGVPLGSWPGSTLGIGAAEGPPTGVLRASPSSPVATEALPVCATAKACFGFLLRLPFLARPRMLVGPC